nr:hypothetical protein [Tanacetum cinerariifolium]
MDYLPTKGHALRKRGSNHRKKQGLSWISATPTDLSLNTSVGEKISTSIEQQDVEATVVEANEFTVPQVDTTGTLHMFTVDLLYLLWTRLHHLMLLSFAKLEANVLVDVDYHGYPWLRFMR